MQFEDKKSLPSLFSIPALWATLWHDIYCNHLFNECIWSYYLFHSRTSWQWIHEFFGKDVRLCEAAYLSLLIVYSTGCPWYLLATMCLSCYDLLGKKEEKYWRWSRKLTCFMWFGGFYQNCPRWWHCFKRLSVGDENKRFFCVGLFELFFLIFEHHCPSYFLFSFSSVCRWYKVDFLSTLDFSVK